MNVAYFLNTLRSLKIPLASVALFSLVCTQVPLFNYLGFEFSALTALLLGFLGGMVTISLWNKRLPLPPDVPPDESFWRYFTSLTRALVVISLLPVVVMSANAIFVKNCSFKQGLMFYGLLVLPGVLFCSSLALLISVSSFRWKRVWFSLLYSVLLLHIVFVTFTRPQIYAFNPVVGFFPGITYDETMAVEGRLLLYRWATVSASLLLFIWAVVLHRRTQRASSTVDSAVRTRTIHITELAGAVVLTAIVVGVFAFSNRLGLSSPRSHVEQELGGKIETRHFVIYYPAGTIDATQAMQLAQLHEFYFTKLADEMRVVSVRKIQSFLYSSAEQKGRLIGAGRTNIAKPWLWQMHLNLNDVESSLKHEMVHVLAADFGFPLVRVGLNPGLIEGLATAVERVQDEESVHRVAAQILSVGISVNMERLFSFSGFAGTYPGVSYSLAGSFCRFLIDQYGMRRFKLLYRSVDFRAVYNKDAELLFAEWRQHLERYRMTEGDRVKAAYRYKRGSIFAKECARVIANINAETRRMAAQGDYAGALASAKQSLELSRSPEAMFQTMTALMRLGRHTEAAEFAEEMLGDSTVAHMLVPMKLQLGDSYWAVGDTARAREQYAQLLSVHINLATDEACALRLDALGDHELATGLKPYFLNQQADSVRMSVLQASLRKPRHKELKTYLLAREYAAQGNERRAIAAFSEIRTMHLYLFEFQRQLRLARMNYTLGEYQRAKIHFWQSMNYTNSEPLLFRIQEWVDRCDWMVKPPHEIFERKEGELQSFREPGDPCGCDSQRVSFLPALID